MKTIQEAYIVTATRTPVAKAPRGAFKNVHPADMLAHCLRQVVAQAPGIDPERIDDIIVGCASQVDEQGADIARTSALLAGWGDHVPGMTINRFCASGIDAVAHGAARLRAGDLGLAVAGGVESVSRVPLFADRLPLSDDEIDAKLGHEPLDYRAGFHDGVRCAETIHLHPSKP